MRWPSTTPSAHAGHFASVADIARAKGELFESLPAGVTACVNLDDAYAGLWQTWLVTPARSALAGRRARCVTDCQLHSDRVALTLATPLGPIAADSRAGRACGAQRPDGGQPGDCPGRVGVGDCPRPEPVCQRPAACSANCAPTACWCWTTPTTPTRTPCAPRCACWRRSRRAPRRAGRYRRIGRWRPGHARRSGRFARELGIDSLHGLGELSAHGGGSLAPVASIMLTSMRCWPGLRRCCTRRRRCW